MIKSVVFDLDETLYEEKEFVMSGFKAVSKYLSSKYGLNPAEIFETLMSDFERGIRKKNFDALLEKIGLKENVKKLVNIYRTHTPDISLYKDAKEILPELKCKYNLGLVTDGKKKTQENKISALSITEYFDVIIITYAYGRDYWKPSSKPFKIALEKLGSVPEEAIYVGDNPVKDFFGAKKLGIHTVRVKRGRGEYDHINVDDNYEADYTIPNLLTLKVIIDQINSERDK
jgi:putative hydrolase of the HAD superfamily